MKEAIEGAATEDTPAPQSGGIVGRLFRAVSGKSLGSKSLGSDATPEKVRHRVPRRFW